MDVHYMNTGSVQSPRYRNDIGANLVKQILLLLGYPADSFMVSLQRGVICVYMQQEVVFVKSLEEFYNTKIKTELVRLSEVTDSLAKQVTVLQNTLLLMSGNRASSSFLRESMLFKRLFVIPLIKGLNCKMIAELILQGVQRVLPLLHCPCACKHTASDRRCPDVTLQRRFDVGSSTSQRHVFALSEAGHAYPAKRLEQHLSRTSIVTLVRALRVVKQLMDNLALQYNVDTKELANVHKQLRVFVQHTDTLLRHVGSYVRRLCYIEPIGHEKESMDLVVSDTSTLYVEYGTKLTACIRLYTTITLFRTAMLYYMDNIVSVNASHTLHASRDAIAEWIEVGRTRAAYVFEFLECCRPGNITAVSMLEVDGSLTWMLKSCYLKITQIAIEDRIPMVMVPKHWSIHGEYKLAAQDRVIRITNDLLGELEWTDDPASFSYLCFEAVSDRPGCNIYTIRLEYPRIRLLTVQYYGDGLKARVAFQSPDMANDIDHQWRIIPIFLDDVTPGQDGPFVVIVPVSYPYTALVVRENRFGYCLGLSKGDPGPKGYWKLSKVYTTATSWA